MPKTMAAGAPEGLKPYLFHGLELEHRPGAKEALGDCPWCGRAGKFSVNVASGKWRCLLCAQGSERGGGNVQTFLRLLHDAAVQDTKTADLEELAKVRGLLRADTLDKWGVCRSPLTGDWLVPGWQPGGKEISQLYRWAKLDGRYRLLATPGVKHGLHGLDLLSPEAATVYVCEGWGDGAALWELLRSVRSSKGGLVSTDTPSNSLLTASAVLAVPGCGVFDDSWAALLTQGGRQVVLLYDNDHPRRHPRTGELQEPAAQVGLRRAVGLLGAAGATPQQVQYLHWGDKGYDPGRPDGQDLRDLLTQAGEDVEGRAEAWQGVWGRLRAVPEDWLTGRELRCDSWAAVVAAGRKALRWTEGLDRGLSVMLAVVASTKAVGDQLWAKIIGPPSCGKSVLCEAVSTAKRYVAAKSTIRGFHSGFKTDAAGRQDNSLVHGLRDKTLVTKDGDTLLQSPNLGQILAEARDIYDRTSRTHYRNRMGKDYEGVNMTWLLCGTSSLRQLDSSELGERFLDCVIVEDIDEDLEDEVGWRVANRADREMSFEADGKPETRDSPEMLHFKNLVGGYVNHLRQNAQRLLDGVRPSADALKRCQRLAKFVACMRARPSSKQEEKAERELSYRLISQLVRLAKCLGAVLQRTEADEEVMRRVTRTALDTARGKTLELCKLLQREGKAGAELATLAAWTQDTEDKCRGLLVFLSKIGVAERYQSKVGVLKRWRWRLTERFSALLDEVLLGGGAV